MDASSGYNTWKYSLYMRAHISIEFLKDVKGDQLMVGVRSSILDVAKASSHLVAYMKLRSKSLYDFSILCHVSCMHMSSEIHCLRYLQRLTEA